MLWFISLERRELIVFLPDIPLCHSFWSMAAPGSSDCNNSPAFGELLLPVLQVPL